MSAPDEPAEPADHGSGDEVVPGAPAAAEGEARRALEAVLMVAESPVDPQLLGQLLEVAPARVDELCGILNDEYAAEGRGFELARVAGGWRYQSHPEQSAYVERFVLEGQTARLSAAALETLAIIAYKQPVSRAQVAAIRGVNVDGVVRTLTQRGLIAETGRDPGPGQATLYGTTPLFLERLGLDSVDQLPPLGDHVPDADVVEQLEAGLRPDPTFEVGSVSDLDGSGDLDAGHAPGDPGDGDAPGDPGGPPRLDDL